LSEAWGAARNCAERFGITILTQSGETADAGACLSLADEDLSGRGRPVRGFDNEDVECESPDCLFSAKISLTYWKK